MNAKTILAIFFILGSTVLNLKIAICAPVTIAEATIDWKTLSITAAPLGTSPTPTINWSKQISRVDANAEDLKVTNSVYAYDWNSEINSSDGNAITYAKASVNSLVLHSYAQDSNPSIASEALSGTERDLYFSVTGNGYINFSVDYKLDTLAVFNNLIPISNNGYETYLYASLDAFEIDTLKNFSDQATLSIYDFDINVPTHSQGTLSVNLPVNDGRQYWFRANTFTNVRLSAVPLPTSIWLFISSLVAIFTINTAFRTKMVGYGSSSTTLK